MDYPEDWTPITGVSGAGFNIYLLEKGPVCAIWHFTAEKKWIMGRIHHSRKSGEMAMEEIRTEMHRANYTSELLHPPIIPAGWDTF